MTRVHQGTRAWALVAGAALLGACPRPIEEMALNQPPVARLVVPQLWPAGEPAAIDGALSEDPEGAPLRFRATFGDGTADAEGAGSFEHVFAEPGSYAVELLASDEQGLDARVQARVVVIGDELEECTCELPCVDGSRCAAGVCLLFASSLEGDGAPAFEDELSCP